jgi:hypothetical protein
MNDHHSIKPLTDALVGGLIGLLTLVGPIYVVIPIQVDNCEKFCYNK